MTITTEERVKVLSEALTFPELLTMDGADYCDLKDFAVNVIEHLPAVLEELKRQLTVEPAHATTQLKRAMEDDDEYAWSWHCNIAMALMDAGSSHENANLKAASVMRTCFGIDTKSFEYYKRG